MALGRDLCHCVGRVALGQGQLRTVVVWHLEADVRPCGRGAEALVAGRQLGPALLLLSSQLLHCPLWKGLRLRSQAQMDLGVTHSCRDCQYTHSISVSILEIA